MNRKSVNNWVNQTAGEQRCANRGQVQWPPLVTLGVGCHKTNNQPERENVAA